MYNIYASKFGANRLSDITYLFYFGASRLYPKRINFFCKTIKKLLIKLSVFLDAT
jgi:hypothetical protein